MKGGENVKYSKPEISFLAVASQAIQGSSDKTIQAAPEVLNGPIVASQFAYEADE